MDERPGDRADRREDEEAHAAETPGDRAPERHQPEAVEDQMRPVGVKEGVGEKTPDGGRLPAGKHRGDQHRMDDARRNEGEGQHHLQIGVVAEEFGAAEMNGEEDGHDRRHRRRDVEDRLAVLIEGRAGIHHEPATLPERAAE